VEEGHNTHKNLHMYLKSVACHEKNYDSELQSGRMFLTQQMAAIPTFMPSGTFKTNISLPLKLIYTKFIK